MFRTVPLSIIRRFSLKFHKWLKLMLPICEISVWHIPLLRVQWEIPDDGQKNCTKHVEFYYKNKFEKLVHPVSFIIRIPSSCNPAHHKARRVKQPLITFAYIFDTYRFIVYQFQFVSLSQRILTLVLRFYWDKLLFVYLVV